MIKLIKLPTIDQILKSKKITDWDLADAKIYTLFKEYPSHTNRQEVLAKILILGRVYVIALERRKEENKRTNTQFYDNTVTSLIEANIDTLFNPLRTEHDEANLILQTHKSLINIIIKTGTRQRTSFASKYLHFSFPEKYYIYDSYAKSAINKYVRFSKNYAIHNPNIDKEYSEFYSKCNFLHDEIKNQHGYNLTKREFDRLLYFNS